MHIHTQTHIHITKIHTHSPHPSFNPFIHTPTHTLSLLHTLLSHSLIHSTVHYCCQLETKRTLEKKRGAKRTGKKTMMHKHIFSVCLFVRSGNHPHRPSIIMPWMESIIKSTIDDMVVPSFPFPAPLSFFISHNRNKGGTDMVSWVRMDATWLDMKVDLHIHPCRYSLILPLLSSA